MQIKRVFDIIGPSGFVPNGWNYNYSNDFWNHNFIVNHEFINTFLKKYNSVSIYDCNLNISENDVKNLHISELHYHYDNNKVQDGSSDKLFFYTIHPFGSIDTCLGRNINYHQHSHCFDFISNKAKFFIKNATNFYLIFDYSSEGDIRKELFENLHEKCKELELPPSKIIIITSAMNSRSIYEKYLENKHEDEQFYTAYYCWGVINKRGETNTILSKGGKYEFNGIRNKNTLMTYHDLKNSKNRNKKALILNRRIAPHRVITLSLLESDNLLDEVDYSIDFDMYYEPNSLGKDLMVGNSYDGKLYLNDTNIKNKMLHGLYKLQKKGKSTVDYEDINGVWGFGFEDKRIYMNTYFSVITETLFYENGYYISEKTFKGFAHLHPFVVVGKPGILKYLKKLGFKTFSDFWSEEYDNIEDDSDRMIELNKVISSLIKKTNEEWDFLTEQIIPILKHNRETLLKYDEDVINSIYINNLFKLLENEPNKENYFLL